MTDSGPTVGELAEDELIARFAPLLPQGDALVPTGDDAAVVELSDPRVTITTDALVEGAHFRLDWSTGADVGWRAIMQNAPDVAAMGAVPVGFVVSLVMPAHLPVRWVEDLARGMAEACEALHAATGRACGVVGGDLAGGPAVVVAVTAFGDLAGRPAVLRSGARAEDVLAHAGTLGRSAAGLALLDAALDGEGLAREAIATYRRPRPPIGRALAAAGAGAHAMMDVSDGLVRDAARIARASGVAIDLEPPEADEVVTAVAARLERDSSDWVLGGGEDHGFLAAFAEGELLPEGFTAVGRVLGGPPGIVTVHSAPPSVRGWDHFGGAGRESVSR